MKIDPSSFEDDYVCTPNDPYEQVIKDFLVNQDRELTFLGFLQTLLPGVSAQQNAEAIPPVANIGAVTENQWTGICNSLLNIVRWFAPRVTGNHACKLTQIYSLSYIALSKREQITDSKLGKVIDSVKEEIGIDLAITPDQIKSVYNAIGAFINPENAINTFTVLSRGIAGNSLRLQLILTQSAGSGLTSYISIINAIKEFPDFTWGKVSRLFPLEGANFGAAMNVVGTNTYYGFSNDLELVRSTKFKNLAYIAITLLQKQRSGVRLPKALPKGSSRSLEKQTW